MSYTRFLTSLLVAGTGAAIAFTLNASQIPVVEHDRQVGGYWYAVKRQYTRPITYASSVATGLAVVAGMIAYHEYGLLPSRVINPASMFPAEYPDLV